MMTREVESIVQTPSQVAASSVAHDITDEMLAQVFQPFQPYEKQVMLSELSCVKGDLEAAHLELESLRQKEKTWQELQGEPLSPVAPVKELQSQIPAQLPSPMAFKPPPGYPVSPLSGISSMPTEQIIEPKQHKPLTAKEQSQLEAAYEQIAQLNSQMAHLYTELTFARTGSYRIENPTAQKGKFEGELCKRSEQIGVLVQDIRHLQADLEFHQQRLTEEGGISHQLKMELEDATQENINLRMKMGELEAKVRHAEIDEKYVEALKRNAEGSGGDPNINQLSFELQRERQEREREVSKYKRLNERLQKSLTVMESQRHKIYILEKQVQKLQRCPPGRAWRNKTTLPKLPNTAREPREQTTQ